MWVCGARRKAIEIAVFETEDVACQMKRADLAAAVGQ